MHKYYPQILGILDKLTDLNEKLDKWAGPKMDNVWFGVAAMGVLILVAFWGVGEFNKK